MLTLTRRAPLAAVTALALTGAVAAPVAGAATSTRTAAPTSTAAKPKAVVKKVPAFRLTRLGVHRVLVSWKAQKGASRYQVLRPSGTKTVLLATVRTVLRLRSAEGAFQESDANFRTIFQLI